jgi:methylthioribose-1-phosphate isomerase
MRTIGWEKGKVRFLDQTRLPHEEITVFTDDYRTIGEAIRSLKVRGAPAIGVAAAYGAALAVCGADIPGVAAGRKILADALTYLAQTRPTAVNLSAALNRISSIASHPGITTSGQLREAVLAEAEAIEREDVEACRRLALHGSELISAQSSILTHCNTGALATAGEGTALNVIITAHRQGKVVRVYVDETRPLLQGSRLTAWELLREGIETVLIVDSAAATVLQRGMVQAVFVGADRIAANGDVANKIGTYAIASVAKRHDVPLYVVAPMSSVDLETPTGRTIPVEERDASEITHISGIRVAPAGVRVFSPAFDITPNELITAIVTEVGVLRPPFGPAIRGAIAKGQVRE